eukprot:scpid98259/ scgid23654/ 
MLFYNGHQRTHTLKYQYVAVWTADGLILSMYGGGGIEGQVVGMILVFYSLEIRRTTRMFDKSVQPGVQPGDLVGKVVASIAQEIPQWAVVQFAVISGPH